MQRKDAPKMHTYRFKHGSSVCQLHKVRSRALQDGKIKRVDSSTRICTAVLVVGASCAR